MASLKSRPWWVLWVRGCPWLVLAPKVFQPYINHLVLVLCRFVWIVENCQFFVVPSRSSSTPFYPSKMMWTRERALIPYSSVVFNLDSHLSPSRNWDCVTNNDKKSQNIGEWFCNCPYFSLRNLMLLSIIAHNTKLWHFQIWRFFKHIHFTCKSHSR